MESERVKGANEEISAYNPLVNPSAPQKISYTQDGANSQENSTLFLTHIHSPPQRKSFFFFPE